MTTVQIDWDDYEKMLNDRFAEFTEYHCDVAAEDLYPQFLEYMQMWAESGCELPGVWELIDNYVACGDFVNRTDETDEEWERYCNDETLFYNENYACTNLGW